MLVVVGGVAASAGVLSPILTYWISSKAGSSQGWELGKRRRPRALASPWARRRAGSCSKSPP